MGLGFGFKIQELGINSDLDHITCRTFLPYFSAIFIKPERNDIVQCAALKNQVNVT